MLARRISLYSIMLLILWPIAGHASSFPTQKHSNLPCLFGQNNFAERLMANNPQRVGRTYPVSDALLGHLMLNVKVPVAPFRTDTLALRFPKFNTLAETAEYTTTGLSSIGKIGGLGEVGIYFNRFTMLYIAALLGEKKLNTIGFVIGNQETALNWHISLGKFPIYFGAGASEYPLVGTLQANAGVAANLPAVSLNGGYRWNMEHETKFRVFSFVEQLVPVRSEREEQQNTARNQPKKTGRSQEKEKVSTMDDAWSYGANLEHEWASSIGIVNGGLSGVVSLPIRIQKQGGDDGLNAYLHFTSGPWKLKVEGLSGGTVSIIRKQGIISTMKKLVKSNRKETTKGYIGHGEIAYRLPFKQRPTVVIGYTGGNTGLLAAQKRVFIGFKGNFFANLQYVVGYQYEQGLKKEIKGVQPKYAEIGNANQRTQEWLHSITLQLNWSV